jgi:hypothetical protein
VITYSFYDHNTSSGENMKMHVKILGWLYIALGVLGILFGFGVALLVAGGGWISGDAVAVRVTSIVAICIGSVVFFLSVPGVLTGIGLLSLRLWGRFLAILLGILNLPSFPIGTALGVYTLYVMLDNEMSELFVG